MKEINLNEKIIRVHFDAPISVVFDPETGNLFVENNRIASSRIAFRAIFSPQAVQQLLGTLRQLEEALKMTGERLVETNFLDKTDIL